MIELPRGLLGDIRQTPWTVSDELLTGLGTPRYCEVVLIVEQQPYLLTRTGISRWEEGSPLIPLTTDGHDLNGLQVHQIVGQTIINIRTDADQEAWLLLSGGIEIGFRVEYGSGLVAQRQ